MKLLVSGLINVETTLRVEHFPVPYEPVRYPFFGVETAISGVGLNVAKALTTLGNRVRLCSMVGRDMGGDATRAALREADVDDRFVLERLAQTPQSVILYDGEGRRQINVDLKDVQEREYPEAVFEEALEGCDVAVMCNVNFSRRFLDRARRAGALVASDVHAISDPDDPYDADFMRAADVLFLSDERLPEAPETFATRLHERYGARVIVVGLGAEGALLSVRGERQTRVPAVVTRQVVNTIGAGDALFSAFLHAYARSGNALEALQKATVFASYKIGVKSAAEGFLTAADLEKWTARLQL
jgi:ribokinase